MTKRFKWLLLLIAPLWAPNLSAQSVRPVIVEYKTSARGKFELTNVTMEPLNVVIEPRSFQINEEGDGVYGPLDERIHLKLSAMSLRIPPKQSRFVFYQATADSLPAWFVIYSVFGGQVNANGANLQVELPHTVYLLQKVPLQKQDVQIESFHYSHEEHALTLRLVNQGSSLGRVLGCEATGDKRKSQESGFPLLPRSHRSVAIRWPGEDAPKAVSVRFANFVLKQDLRGRQQ